VGAADGARAGASATIAGVAPSLRPPACGGGACSLHHSGASDRLIGMRGQMAIPKLILDNGEAIHHLFDCAI